MPTLTPQTHKAALAKRQSFDLDAATERLDMQIGKAGRAARTAVDEAMAAGAMLIEIREQIQFAKGHANQHTPIEIQFDKYLDARGERHGVSRATLYRWIGYAEAGRKALAESIDIEAIAVPVSNLLTLPLEELPEEAREARQLLFDWMQDNTISEAARGVVVDGDPSSRITRAHNGKTKGGAGGDRKDYDTFIARKFSDVGSHAKHWDSFSPGQKDKTYGHIANLLSNLPTPLVEAFLKSAKEEMKKR